MRIDTHHHMLPLVWLNAIQDLAPPWVTFPAWSESSSLATMSEFNITTSILSIPAIAITSAQGAAFIARSVNEYAADLHSRYPTRYGFFASVPPLTDTAAALAEIEYALDVLNADGIGLFTSYDGLYLGNPLFQPIWQDLNTRSAVVFIHPIQAQNSSTVSPALNPGVIDFPHETTRTAADLIVSGTLSCFPALKIILSHACGSLPYIAERVAFMLEDNGVSNMTMSQFVSLAKLFYYDLATASWTYPLELLLEFADPKRILWGSDYSFVGAKWIREQVEVFDDVVTDEDADEESDDEPDDELREDILWRNAARLFPRFAGGGNGTGNGTRKSDELRMH